MKLKTIEILKYPPIACFKAENLANIVAIAGPNGVGKTRLFHALAQKFGSVNNRPEVRLVFAPTSSEESLAWEGSKTIDTEVEADAGRLQKILHSKNTLGNFASTVVIIDSARAFELRDAPPPANKYPDPYQQEVNWSYGMSSLTTRFQELVVSLYTKIRSEDERLINEAKASLQSGGSVGDLSYTDPIQPFKELFTTLLPNKYLHVELGESTPYYTEGSPSDANRLKLEPIS